MIAKGGHVVRRNLASNRINYSTSLPCGQILGPNGPDGFLAMPVAPQIMAVAIKVTIWSIPSVHHKERTTSIWSIIIIFWKRDF